MATQVRSVNASIRINRSLDKWYAGMARDVGMKKSDLMRRVLEAWMAGQLEGTVLPADPRKEAV